MKLRISGRARARIRTLDAWWRSHRLDAPDLFKEELGLAFARIVRFPKLRLPYAQIGGEPVWRVFMPTTEQHVYFTVDEAANEIVVQTVWGGRRGRGPKL